MFYSWSTLYAVYPQCNQVCGLRALTFHAEELRYRSSEWIADKLISGHLQNIVSLLYIGGFAFLSAF